MKFLCLFLFSTLTMSDIVQGTKKEDSKERELFGFGAYHPLMNLNLSGYTNLHHRTDNGK